MRRIAVLIFILSLPAIGGTFEIKAPFAVDAPAYFARHDIAYRTPALEGYEGFPIGNGDLGAMVWCHKTGLTLQINKSDAWSQPDEESEMLLRSCGQLTIDLAAPLFDWLYLDDFEGRLSLYRADASFASTTPFLKLQAESFVQTNRNVLALRCRAEGMGDLKDEGTPVRVSLDRWGSRGMSWWYGGIQRGAENDIGQAKAGARKGDIYTQESLKGLDFAVACRMVGNAPKSGKANRRRAEIDLAARPAQEFALLVAVVTGEESKNPLCDTVALLDASEKDGLAKAEADHRQWWADFWGRSFAHLGDDYLENLYYLHLYLMGSSSRGKYPAIFNGALWTWNRDVCQWGYPHHWHMQQSYWSLCAANRTELMLPYLETYWLLKPQAEEYARCRGFGSALLWNEIHDYAGRMAEWQRPSFIHAFTPATQIGQYFWHYYLYTGDETFLKEKAYPFMKKAAEFYLQYLKWDEVRKEYYIYPASPYECEDGNDYRNTVTDLAMICASFRPLLDVSQQLNLDADKREQWRKALDRLPDHPMVALPEGEAIGVALDKEGRPLQCDQPGYGFCATTSPVFPAGVLGLKDRGTRLFEATALRAKLHPEHSLAISPVAVVAARLGIGDEAYRRLKMRIRQLQHFPQGLFYNIDHWHGYSRYASKVPDSPIVSQRDYITDRAVRYKNIPVRGTGRRINMPMQPFVQCGPEPLEILAAAVNEMLLQSYDGTLRVFPATPADWPAAFALRARGGFLVSGEKEKNAPPRYVLIESLLGRGCRLENPWPGREVAVTGKDGKIASEEGNPLIFSTRKGEKYLLYPADSAELPRTVFTGQPNQGPKIYQEAVLGKARDF
ncbi:MAG: glycoside hydrolase N-terminal domain-containing protein [Armatimonadetes bacterium]|nr:glycoside hydrolase N-terminal domain-containing protein [Armatimonadota bacterium]